jgi:ribosomal protein S12 methylthiotransferase
LAHKINVGLVSLGCDKNRVDSEIMLGVLSDNEYKIVNDEKIADVIIVNTCGFIEAAKEESIDTILEMARNKENGRCKLLIATGCLAERYSDDLLNEIPELDVVLGTGNYMEIDSIIKEAFKEKKRIKRTENIDYNIEFENNRVLTTPLYTAYIKIAEGCNNRCSYCIIPKLRGKYRSRSIENIVDEATRLSINGTKELILVAQDTTKYGIDIYGKKMLPSLIQKLSDIKGIEWIRLLYCYPEDIDNALIEEIKTNNKVCKYIDIPLQHVNDDILINMRRKSRNKDIINLITNLRSNIPDIVIRTTFIVGFPGETEDTFNQLLDFLNEYKIDHVGVFTYSQEEETEAFLFPNQIDDETKKKRQNKLCLLQSKISREKGMTKIGKVLDVLIEGIGDDGVYIGRYYGYAPDIDGVVYVRSNGYHINIGNFVKVKITDALDYDLVGEVSYESCK